MYVNNWQLPETFLLFWLGCHSDLHTFDHPELGSEKKKRNLLTESQRRKPEVLILVLWVLVMFCRVVDWRYVVGGSKTGDVDRDNSHRDRFSINALLNGEGSFRQYIWPKIPTYVYICILTKKLHKIWNSKQMAIWGGGSYTWTAGGSSG